MSTEENTNTSKRKLSDEADYPSNYKKSTEATRNSHPSPSDVIFSTGLLVSKIIALLSVSDIINCRLVSKGWKTITNSNDMWFLKYIAAAGLDPGVKASGDVRKMYLNRFGRNDMLRVLLDNYHHTNKMAYLKQFYMVAATMYYTEKVDYFDDTLLKLDRFTVEASEYQDYTKVYPYSGSFHGLFTMYAATSAMSVRVGIRYIHIMEDCQFHGNINIVALYHPDSRPEHLCQYLSSPANVPGCVTTKAMTIQPIEETCRKLIDFVGLTGKLTVPRLIKAFYKSITDYIYFAKPELRGIDDHTTSLTESLSSFSAENGGDKRNQIQRLVFKASGDIRKLEAINRAKELSLSANIITLLENSHFSCYNLICGRIEYHLCGGNWDRSCLTGEINCKFVLSLPGSTPLSISAWLKTSVPQDACSCIYASLTPKSPFLHGKGYYHTINSKTGSLGSDEVEINISLIKRLIETQFPNMPSLTHVEFLVYILLASNMLDDFWVQGEKSRPLWEFNSLKGKIVVQSDDNSARDGYFKELKKENERLRKEVNWDGSNAPSFDKWEYNGESVESDDNGDGQGDSGDEDSSAEGEDGESGEGEDGETGEDGD